MTEEEPQEGAVEVVSQDRPARPGPGRPPGAKDSYPRKRRTNKPYAPPPEAVGTPVK
jgi:hypothetical protein